MLPQNPQGMSNTDRILLENLKAQSENLGTQTKVLHKLSDSITAHRRETNNLRKDINELRKEFFTGNNKTLSDIKKYFEKTKAPKLSEPKIGEKTKDNEKGFFANALSKLFGPSKYQQKVMDDTAAIRELQHLTYQDINFIKRQYEEPARARERELLAQAIADKMDQGGGESGGKGILGMLTGALVASLTTLFGILGSAIEKAISGLWSGLKSLLDDFDIPRKSGGGRGGGPGAPGAPGAPGTPGTPSPSGPQQNRMPPAGPQPSGPAQPELPNPQQRLPGPGNEPPKLPAPAGAEDAQIKREGPRGTESGRRPSPIEEIRKGQMPGGRPGRPGPVFEPGPGGAKAIIRKLLPWIGIGVMGGAELLSDKETPEIDAKKDEEKASQTSITEDLKKAMKGTIDTLMGFDSALEEAADAIGEAFIKKAVPMLDKMGEITIGNERVNLLPHLGTSLAETLREQADFAKEMADMAKDAASPVINNIVNNLTQSQASQSIPFVAASSVATGAAINNYHRRAGRIR